MPHSERLPTEDARLRAGSILRDHTEGLHAHMDDETVGCRYPGCEDAYWLLARMQGNGPVSIEELLR